MIKNIILNFLNTASKIKEREVKAVVFSFIFVVVFDVSILHLSDQFAMLWLVIGLMQKLAGCGP
jgi:hypothetical protein